MGTNSARITTVDFCTTVDFLESGKDSKTFGIDRGFLRFSTVEKCPTPPGIGRSRDKVGDATQDPPDPAAPRCAPEPELTASNAYYIKKPHPPTPACGRLHLQQAKLRLFFDSRCW